MSDIGLIVLAAGTSSRMGRPKQLLPHRGQSLIRYIAQTAIASVCHPVLVVLGAYSEAIQPELDALEIRIVQNPHWAMGMSTSIRVGIEALQTEYPSVEAAVILVCDQPWISSSQINQLVEHYQTASQCADQYIVASEYAGVGGVPALFPRSFFPQLAALKGDVGARRLLQQQEHLVLKLPYPEGVLDLDTPADYEQLLERSSQNLYQPIGSVKDGTVGQP